MSTQSPVDTSNPSTLEKIKAIFWPVNGYENKKVIPMALMMFCVLFNYTILRDVKDAIIITAPGSGAEVTNFLKIYGTLPMAILVMILYAKMSTLLKKTTLFYSTLSMFLIFFALFAFVIFPNKEFFNMSQDTIQQLKGEYPRLQWFIPVIGYWTYSLYYVFSELWGTVALSVLFWTFANETTRSSEAQRFYALFGLVGNVGLIFSGGLLRWITSSSEVTGASLDQVWGTNLKYITVAFLFFGGLIMFLYNWIQKNVLTDPRLYDPETMGTSKKKKKVKLSFTEGLKVVFSSKYLCFIAMLVLGYGISINLVEITWKSQLKLQYPDTNSYVNFMGFFSQMTGFTTIILMIVGNNILRRLGWFTGAIITPVMVLITGASFFTFVIFRDDMTPLMAALTVTPVLLAVIVGAAQNILSKSTKYSLFDPTKEMSYIPLDDNLKVRGKAAVDGVGGRLGKSGGAIMQQILLVSIVGSTQITIAPILAVIVMAIVGVWLFAVFGLSKQYYALRAKQETKKSKTSAA